MADEEVLVFDTIINAPADLIYRAFTSSTGIREWLCDVSAVNPNEDGYICLAWNHGYYASGHYTQLVPNKRVSFTWIGRNEPDWTDVDVTITPLNGDNEFKVTLHHKGVGNTPEWEDAQAEINKGWRLGFENLKSVLEEGRDLRTMNRPLIGIFPRELTMLSESARESLGVTVDYGVVVSNVVPGFGAEMAGIQSDDVITAVNGEEIQNISALFARISEYAPGDQISVTVYRGAEKLTFEVNTTPQIFQSLPGSSEELAKEIEADSTKLLEKLENVLAGVTEAEASYTPGPEQWSAKETIVEFILHERGLQSWINNLVADHDLICEDIQVHCLFRIRATLTTYPTLSDLLTELRRSFKETVACVAFIEQDFIRRKPSYWRVGYELLEKSLGYQEYIRHIEETIQLAKNAKPA